MILAYAGEAFYQVKDVLDDTLSQTPPSQAPDAIPGTQPQATETVTAPVAAPVVDGATTGQNLDLSGPIFVGPVLDLSESDIGPLKDLDNPASPVKSAPAPVAKPAKNRTAKAKEAGK